jgi:predicted ester cyclase
MVLILESQAPDTVVSGDVVEALERVYGQGDVNKIEALFAPDYVEHDPAAGGTLRGPESVKQFVASFRRAFPDLELTLAERWVEGDTIILHWTGCGTHLGPWQDLAPAGEQLTISGFTVTRIERGKAVEGWSNWEQGALLRQLEVWPYSIRWRTPSECGLDDYGNGSDQRSQRAGTAGQPDSSGRQPPLPSLPWERLPQR